MKLHQKYLFVLSFCVAFYAVAYVYVFYLITNGDKWLTSLRWVVATFPFTCLVAFGAYLLGRLGIDLITYKDYPNERLKLDQVNSPETKYHFVVNMSRVYMYSITKGCG
ncbi:hypothetical protein EON65_13255 [archaeon]|nr:MAG: hypothetical protein EON65_13255 [archaeon]